MSISSRSVNKPMDCSLSKGLSVLTWSASTFSSPSLSWSQSLTDTGAQLERSLPVLTLVLSQPFFDFLSSRTGWLLCQNTSPCSNNWILGLWLGSLGVFTTSSNFWTQLFHPIVFKRNLRRRSRWRIYFLVYDLSSFQPNNFRNTKEGGSVSWRMIAFERVW